MSESFSPHVASSQSDESFDASMVKFSAKAVQIASVPKCFFTHSAATSTLYAIIEITIDAFALY